MPGPGEVLVKVAACGVCRTDLHVVDGDLTEPRLPIIPGHEIVGRVEATGAGSPVCAWRSRRHSVAGAHLRQLFLLPDRARKPVRCTALHGLPDQWRLCRLHSRGGCVLLSAARELRGCVRGAAVVCGADRPSRAAHDGDAKALGIYGFGAAAHIVAQVAQFEQRSVYAFTRPGDSEAQTFARSLGCVWAGGSDEHPGTTMDAAIIFAPVGDLVPRALEAVRKGGTVVLGGIHMSEIPAMPYRLLWGERTVRSVANLTRRDAQEFLAIAGRTPIKTEIVPYALSDANTACGTCARVNSRVPPFLCRSIPRSDALNARTASARSYAGRCDG